MGRSMTESQLKMSQRERALAHNYVPIVANAMEYGPSGPNETRLLGTGSEVAGCGILELDVNQVQNED